MQRLLLFERPGVRFPGGPIGDGTGPVCRGDGAGRSFCCGAAQRESIEQLLENERVFTEQAAEQ
jgi:hypothetical protein